MVTFGRKKIGGEMANSLLSILSLIQVRGQLKLIDFGFASHLLPGADFTKRRYIGGTRNYLSPESLPYSFEDGVVRKAKESMITVGFKSDVWALGIILYQGPCHCCLICITLF
jgi:serine/threonine protein kinase